MKAIVMMSALTAGVVTLGVSAVYAGGCCPGHAAPQVKEAEKPAEHCPIEAAKQKAEKAELKAQTTCPIMGAKIDKKLYVDHEGQRIYVCCSGCLGAVEKDPAAALAKLAERGERAEKIKPEAKAGKQPAEDHGHKH